MTIYFFILNIIITIGAWFLWSYSNDMLFTYLGEAEVNGHMESCYMYDTLSLGERIFTFGLGVFAIAIFQFVWMLFIFIA